jgi:hypothetical protein
MGCNVCACNAGMSNTGVGCANIFRDTYGLIGVPLYATDGTQNGITLASAALNQAFFTARVNDPDSSKRWYPFPSNDGLKEVESVRPESTFKEFTDGTKQFVKKGVKPFVGQITGRQAQPKLVGKLDAIRCVSGGFGFYKIDRDGNLIGEISADGLTLYPIAIDPESFDANFMEATPTEPSYVAITFNFAQSSLDKDLAMITCSEMSYNVKLLRGLIDVCAVFSDPTNDYFTIQLVAEWGSIIDPTTVQGIISSDVSVRNNSVGGGETLMSFVESTTSPGTYLATFANPVADGDNLTVTITKSGFDFTCVSNTLLVIPNS